ncbi:unnamed protein product [Trichogramma brassicae]|uniref:Uncharacterized protein n=1 Tax=Trichogramma brassicae TaxID=86971 RepID=A0A6H5HWQ4_9HYME|nr:unnamed protein product [Trichogramma brassicae]
MPSSSSRLWTTAVAQPTWCRRRHIREDAQPRQDHERGHRPGRAAGQGRHRQHHHTRRCDQRRQDDDRELASSSHRDDGATLVDAGRSRHYLRCRRCCPVANKSAQVIAESLDEQEAAEAAVVNSKLQHLQQARRDFVMSVADVGGTAISLDAAAAADLHVSDISAPPQLLSDIASPPRLYRCPSLDDPYLKPECGRDHPQVAAARDYLQDKRFEDMFARYACRDDQDDDGDGDDAATDFLDQEFLDTLEPGDLIDLDDDDFDVDAAAAAADDVDYCDRHRAKQRTAIPRRRCEPYRYEPDNLERLQKFCDPANYPHYRPSPPHRRSHHRDHHRHHRHHHRRGDGSGSSGRAQPPPGRENLPEDLWDLQDPWANNDCPDRQRDLMDFSKDDDC